MRPLFLFLATLVALRALASDSVPAFTREGFRVPQPGPVFTFPRDHGSHPDYKIEWWYLTGHITAEGSGERRFGFQATFFRSAAPRDIAARSSSPAFGQGQLYLAHMGLLDVKSGRFYHQERLNREGWDADASTSTLAVRNGDWSLRFVDGDATRIALEGGVRGEVRFTLGLQPLKPLARFGEGGYSRKGAAPEAASYYLTFPRLETSGTLRVGEETVRVGGLAWMDHEYSSSQLDPSQVGWDWLSAQLDDGREVMFYALRRRDGSLDPASRLTWIDRTGGLATTDYRWETLETWKSPRTGAVYPHRLRLTTTDPQTGAPKIFLIQPLHPDQELGGDLGGVTYWEGACRVLDPAGSSLGSAYLELTGYDRPVDAVR